MVNEPSSTPPTESKPARRFGMPALIGAGVIVLAVLAGGGFFGYQAYTTSQTQTAVSIANTATAHQNATGTQVAEVTATANQQATATGNKVGTVTARANATGTVVAHITATADTLLSGAPVPFGWNVRYIDTFDSDKNIWSDWSDEDELGSFDWSIENSAFVATFHSNQSVYAFSSPNVQYLLDFYMSVDVDSESIDGRIDYGFMFRAGQSSDDSYGDFYMATVNNNGRYRIIRSVNHYWTYLKSGFSDKISQNGKNTIAIRVIGTDITLYANGQEVDVAHDDAHKTGFTALMMSMPAGLDAQVAFDNFYVLIP